MKELIIIGGGPAGITASVYAARKKMDFTLITKDIGGQAAWSGDIENYTGYQFITGPELADKFRKHLDKYKFDMLEGVGVKRIEKGDGGFAVVAEDGTQFLCRALIIASGKKPRMLGVPGEEEFRNKGVAYCSTCDGPIFSGKRVAVIGGGNSALDAALQMVKIASKVFLINIGNKLTGDAVMIEKVMSSVKAEVMNGTKTLGFHGDKFLKGMKVQKDGSVTDIPIDGAFVEVGLIPNSGIIDFVDLNDAGEIEINCASETSYPGVFAAGDVTDVPEKQIIIAAGDGAKATLSAFRFLSSQR